MCLALIYSREGIVDSHIQRLLLEGEIGRTLGR
jgi:hypothetical protein